MTTESPTSAEAASPSKTAPHQLELTNGAIYLLEGCLQDLSACTTPDKIIKWGKCWKYIRSQNDRLVKVSGADHALDFEKPFSPKPDETPAEQQVRINQLNEAHTDWTKQPKVLALSDKRRDICREAVRWWASHKDTRGKPMAMSENLLLLFEALGLDSDADGAAE